MPSPEATHLVWIDLEMSGLDPDRERIIEIATVVTNASLEIVAEGPEFAIKQPDDVLRGMDEWNTEQHSRSGLVDRVRASNISEADAERATLDFLRAHVPAQTSPMCGNSICLDRRFLYRYMPDLETFFHYRNLDVSTLKELCVRWTPEKAEGMTKRGAHRALQDVEDSIAELRYYRDCFIRLD